MNNDSLEKENLEEENSDNIENKSLDNKELGINAQGSNKIKSKKNNKVIWVVSSLLSVAVLALGSVIAWKLFTNKPQQSNIIPQKETLLFKRTDIEPFKNDVENEKWAEEEFKTNYQSLALREFTKNNLKVDGNSIRNIIEQVFPISKKEIQINLSKYSNFNYLLSSDVSKDLSYLVNNLLYVDNLEIDFIKGIGLMKLDSLNTAINNFIRDPLKKYTLSDFIKYIGDGENDNKKQFIETVIQPNLYITPDTNIQLENIKDVKFDSNNNLLIELQNEGIKYYIDAKDEVGNISISNNTITIESLNYYKALPINEVDLIGLKGTLQTFINQKNNRFSLKKFADQVNSSTFKTQITGKLGIGFENIGIIKFDNNVLSIPPARDYKIIINGKTTSSDNLMDNDGNIIVSGFEFYNDINLVNLSELYKSVNNYINEPENKFTKEEFLEAFNKNEDIKNLIKSNLRISETSILDPKFVQNITLDSLYRINIIFNTDKTNYSIPTNTIEQIYFELEEDNEVNSKLVVKDLKYFNDIKINGADLNNLKGNIQKYISDNRLTLQQFESNNLGYLSTIFKEKIEDYLNIKGLNAVSKISFENNILKITPTVNEDVKYKFTSFENSNLINKDDEIEINLSNLNFFVDMKINNLDNLRSSIINYIVNSNRKLTISEFEQYLNDETKKAEVIKTISDNISIFTNNSRAINETKIKNLTLVKNGENNKLGDLQIELDPEFAKYQLSESSNAGILENNILTIKNLEFYNEINIDTNKLKNLNVEINELIKNNKWTENDFLSANSKETFKSTIARLLDINDISLIDSIIYQNDILKITPLVDSIRNNRNKFVTVESNETAGLIVDNNIQVTGFKFFTEETIINASNIWNAVNDYILDPKRKLTVNELEQYLNNNDQKNEIINQIAKSIDFAINTKSIDSNKIVNLSLVNNLENNQINELQIELDSNFTKYKFQSANDNVTLKDNILTVKNLKFYNAINIASDKLINLNTEINKLIEKNSWTENDFNSVITESSFKSEIARLLAISNEEVINNISYQKGVLTITPLVDSIRNNRNKFVTLESNETAGLIVDNNIQVTGFKFFAEKTITDISNIWNAVNDYILDPNNKLSVQEFETKLTVDSDNIKNIIAKKIKILNVTEPFSADKIKNLSLISKDDQTDELQIELDSDFTKYKLQTSNENVSLENNVLTVKNLRFYNAIDITTDNLKNLQKNIQSYIINNPNKKLTIDEFKREINTDGFKLEIAKYLGIEDANVIDYISYSNDGVLTITPLVDSIRNNRNKFVTTESSETRGLIIDGSIKISGFNFFNLIQLYKTDNLTTIINSIITSNDNQFTPDNFRSYINNSVNLSNLKQTIADNIEIGLNQTLDANTIKNIELNDSNQLVVSLDSEFIKYSLYRNSSAIGTPNSMLNQETTQLIINNLQFYTQISVSDNDLISVKNKINEYITSNNISSGNNISSQQLKEFLQNIKATTLPNNVQQDLLSFVSDVTFNNNVFEISLNNLIKIQPKEIVDENISISNNVISIKDFEFKPSRDFFTWDESGTKITGLTDLGRQQTSIILPSETTEIESSVFANNEIIESVDMSLTQIKEISQGWSLGLGLFTNCTNLKTIKLPNTLTTIGMSSFENCTSLTDVENLKDLKNLSIINTWAFKNCSSLTQISLPNSLTELGSGAFNSSGLIEITLPKLLTKIGQNAFQGCESLISVILSEGITSLPQYMFQDCINLTSIKIPLSINNIAVYAFKNCSNVKLIVPDEVTQQKVISFKIFGISDNRIEVEKKQNDKA